MDVIKATIVGVDFKELEHPPMNETIYADVVLIDRSQGTSIPSIYCLNEDEFSIDAELIQPRGFSPLTEGAFTMMGSVDSINKTKKIIRLRNNKGPELNGGFTLVSYKHLIIASDLNHALLGHTSHEEFSAGLSALLDAIKMRKNVPDQFKTFLDKSPVQTNKKNLFNTGIRSLQGIENRAIEEIVQAHIATESLSNVPTNLASLYKRLYEVHLG